MINLLKSNTAAIHLYFFYCQIFIYGNGYFNYEYIYSDAITNVGRVYKSFIEFTAKKYKKKTRVEMNINRIGFTI